MKTSWMVAILMLFSLTVIGKVSEERLKDLEDVVEIESVRDSEDEHNSKKRQNLRIEFSSEDEGLDAIVIRVAVEITDKKTKQTYLVREMGSFSRMAEIADDEYEGEGYWELHMPYGDFDRLKVTAYAVEFGVMDDDTFVPFQAEFDDVKSYDELIERTTQAFPNDCSLSITILVDR